jgi:hypothetical protein
MQPTSEVLARVSPARSYPGLFGVKGSLLSLVFRTETYDDNPLGWLAHGRIAGGRELLGQATHMFQRHAAQRADGFNEPNKTVK